MPASNYPDDIRNYDKDPRSPYYESQHIQCTNGSCDIFKSEEDMDEDGRCSPECEIQYCPICEDDECGGCEDENPTLMINKWRNEYD